MAKLKGLGRGLDVLLAGQPPLSERGKEERIRMIPIGNLEPGEYQPRTRMDEGALESLAESIRQQGILQPIVVREKETDRFEIIAGERRWRASRRAGLKEVPVIVRQVEDQAVLAIALIENIQRENLNPLEEAWGLQKLIESFHLSHEEAAQAVGRSRSAVTNLLRLTHLTPLVQDMLLEGKMDMGHGRALAALTPADQIQLANQVIARQLSVRQTEALVQQHNQLLEEAAQPKLESIRQQEMTQRDLAEWMKVEERMAEQWGTRVQLKRSGDKGMVCIHYTSLEALNGLLDRWNISVD
jgi:ParB family transcriptional regulator, chromosome partitioning protein